MEKVNIMAWILAIISLAIMIICIFAVMVFCVIFILSNSFEEFNSLVQTVIGLCLLGYILFIIKQIWKEKLIESKQKETLTIIDF